MMIFRWTWEATRPCTWRPGRVTPPPPPACSASAPRSTWRWDEKTICFFLTFDFHVDQKIRLGLSCYLGNLFLSEIQIGWWINAEIIDRFIAWLDYFCELNMNNIQIHEMISLPLSPTPQLIPWPFCTVIQFIQFNRISTVALITFILTMPPQLVCRYLHLHWTNCLAQTESQELAMQRVSFVTVCLSDKS